MLAQDVSPTQLKKSLPTNFNVTILYTYSVRLGAAQKIWFGVWRQTFGSLMVGANQVDDKNSFQVKNLRCHSYDLLTYYVPAHHDTKQTYLKRNNFLHNQVTKHQTSHLSSPHPLKYTYLHHFLFSLLDFFLFLFQTNNTNLPTPNPFGLPSNTNAFQLSTYMLFPGHLIFLNNLLGFASNPRMRDMIANLSGLWVLLRRMYRSAGAKGPGDKEVYCR